MQDHLAITLCLEDVVLFEMTLQRLVVVDFAINAENHRAVLACERLCPRVCE